MPNYSNSIIYKITSEHCDEFYVGSTTKTDSQRLARHARDFERYKAGKFHYMTSFDILELGDYDITIIERVNCNTRKELELREAHYINLYKDNIVNKVVVGRTGKQYYKDNKEKISGQKKEKNVCPSCGGQYAKDHRSRHLKSAKHQRSLQSSDSDVESDSE